MDIPLTPVKIADIFLSWKIPSRSQVLITRARCDEMDDWFRTEAGCRDYIRRLRWPDGFLCRHCGVIEEPWIMKRGVFRYRACDSESSLTAGTVF